MLKFLVFISSFLVCVYCRGELTILHSPKSIIFKGHEKLDESNLKEVYTAALGYSIEHGSSWSGMYLKDPFDVAQAVVSISVDGISDLGGGKGHHFPLRTNTNDDDTFYALKKRIEYRNPLGGNIVADINLSDGLDSISNYEFLHGIKHIKKPKGTYLYLKPSIEEDRNFLQEVALLNAIADKIEAGVVKRDYSPDYYRMKCVGLHAISDLYGDNSTQTKEAKQLLTEAISRLNDAFITAYDGKVLVTVISSDASHTRRTRSANQPQPKADADLNLAKTYDKNYPVMFNIILWFGIIMVFSLLAISLVIGNMDPGRDSIIYRMTSTRMKKDN